MEVTMEFRDVVGYEDLFMVSDTGVVYSKRTEKTLKQCQHPHGYLHIATKIGGRNGVAKCFKVHRLVAEAFIPNPDGKPFVNHIDGVKTNNNVSNLEWVTNSENMLHAFAIGLAKPRHQEYRLTEEERDFVVSNYKPYDKKYGARALARKYSVCKTTILRYIAKG